MIELRPRAANAALGWLATNNRPPVPRLIGAVASASTLARAAGQCQCPERDHFCTDYFGIRKLRCMAAWLSNSLSHSADESLPKKPWG